MFYFASLQCFTVCVFELDVSPVFVWVVVLSSYPSRPLSRRNRQRVTQKRLQHQPRLRFDLQERGGGWGGSRPDHHVCHRWDRERKLKLFKMWGHFHIMQQYKTPLLKSNVPLTTFPQVKLNQSFNSSQDKLLIWGQCTLCMFKVQWRIMHWNTTNNPSNLKREVSYFNRASIHSGYLKEVKVQLQRAISHSNIQRQRMRAGSSSRFTSCHINYVIYTFQTW